METLTNYDDQYNVPEPIQPQFEDYFEILGDTAGGMGEVYFCKDKRSGELYALKKAQPEENKRQLFEQEAAFALELGKHPNIVYTHTVGRKENEYYIVMELVASKSGQENGRPHGNTLKDEFNRRAEGVEPETGFKWAIAFCEGMAYLNGKGMTAHKDIKPENIFITPDGTLKIGDFGLAGLSAKKAAGTRGYRAPEVKDGNFSVRSDIYAFGVVLYQLFNKGYNPTEPTYYTNAGTRMDDQDAQFPQPQEIRSRYAERIIRKCMALNSAERYGSFKDLQADLIQELKNIVPDYEYHAPEEGTMGVRDTFNKALGWDNLKDYNKAIKFYTTTIQLAPQIAATYSNRGNAYYQLKEYNNAIKDCTQAIELDAQEFRAYTNRGIIYSDLQEYNKAISDYAKAIELDSKSALPYYNRGNLYKHLKDYNKALADYTKAIELDHINAYNNRGLVYSALGKYDKAIVDFTKAIEQNSKDDYAYTNRGNAYRKMQKTNEALTDYMQAIKLNSKNDTHYYNRGVLYTDLQEYDNALADFTKAIELAPKADAHNNRGFIYCKLQEYSKAISDFTKAIELNPQYAEAYNNRGVSYLKLHHYNNALIDYTKTIELGIRDTIAYFNRGFIYQNLQDYPKAIADYTQALELNPQFVNAYDNLIALYNQLNKPEEAKKWETLKKKNCPESDQ